MQRLYQLLGQELEFDQVNAALRDFVRHHHPPVVGAAHVTCSDEAECECINAFQDGFVDRMLPELKFWNKAPFRTSNLGGRYEWGAVRIAEQHFATQRAQEEFKTVVVKISSHVGVVETPEGRRFGPLLRYGSDSTSCGALHALLAGVRQPFTKDIADAFYTDGIDGVELLRDPQRVDPALRNLFASVLNARVQARRAMLDIQDYHPTSPTLYVVLACVTINRPERDTELPVGVYSADWREQGEIGDYCGLGDRPDKYALSAAGARVCVTDEWIHRPRKARDHRAIVRRHWEVLCRESRQSAAGQEPTPGRAPAPMRKPIPVRDPTSARESARFAEILAAVGAGRHAEPENARSFARDVLEYVADADPVCAAIVLFADGIAGLYHTNRVQRLLREPQNRDDARRVIADVRHRVDTLPEQFATRVVESITARHA